MDADELIESIIRATMFLFGVLGNSWLVLVSVPKHGSQISTSEVLFINLALSNLITNCLVDLPDTVADFAGRWFLGETFCGVFHFCADLSETSSIVSTLLISAFWHQKLVGSLKRGAGPVQMDSLRLIGCLLAASWTMAAVFSTPHFFFVSVEGTNASHEECRDAFPDSLSREVYEVLFLTVANALPVAGIVVASARIVVALLESRRRVQTHGCEPSAGERGRRPAARAATSVLAVAAVVLLCWVTHLLLRISSSISSSSLVVEVASYVAASYTSIIPYMFLHGVKKLSCSPRRPTA